MADVLLADDDFAALEGLAKVIEAAGHRVIRAGDGIDAFRIATSQRVDIVVCDEHMPRMSGSELISAMRAHARLANLPAILLEKPVDIAALLAAIDKR
jgi:CheY-like chemotaxis protein